MSGHEEAAPAEAEAEELQSRLLGEARERAQGRALRRFLVLVAAAFVLMALGARGNDAPLAYVAGVGFLIAAVWILWTAR